MDLDLAHIYRTGTDAFQQRDTAAGCPFVVGGDKTFQVRAVFHHHLAVGAEAAGGDNDAFSGHGEGFVLFCGQTHAGDFAVFEQDVADRRIKHYVDVAFVDVTHQAADQIAAYRRAVFWTVRTVNAHSAGGGDVIQHNAAGCQPFNRLRRILHEAAQQFRVVLVTAPFQALLVEQLFAVLDPFHPLEARLCGIHPGRSFDGVPADGWHLLNDQHARAFIVGLNGCGQTGAAATHYHHIHAAGRVRVSALFCRQRFAGFQHRFRDRFFHRFTLAGCTRDGIHVRGVGVQNAGTDLFKAGDKLNVFARARRQRNIGDAIGFQANVDYQFVNIVLHLLSEHAWFEF